MLLYLIHAARRIFIPYVIPCRIPALIRRKFRVHTAVKHGVPDVPRGQRVLVRRLIQRPHGVVLGRIVHAVVVDIAARPAEYPPPGQRKHWCYMAVTRQKQRVAPGVFVDVIRQRHIVRAPLPVVAERLAAYGQHTAEHGRKTARRQPQRPPGQGTDLGKQIDQQLRR